MALHSTAKIFNLIKAEIESNFDPGYPYHVRSMFGIPRDQWEKIFHQANTIMIILDEEPMERETNATMDATMKIVFFVIEQIMGKSKTKYNYLSDKFRDYLTEDGYGKRWVSLQTEYPDETFEPFYPENKILAEILKGGLVRWEIPGHIDYEVFKHT